MSTTFEKLGEEAQAGGALAPADSSRFEAIGRLAGGLAHDFNNLLSIIQACAGCAMESLGEADPAYHDIAAIQQTVRRAAKLTADLLALGRREPVEPEVLALSQAVRDVLPMLRTLAGAGVAIVTRLEADDALVEMGRSQLERVLTNLVANAKDAMPGGGTIGIEIGPCQGAAVSLPRLRPGMRVEPGVRLTVRDSGAGMNETTRRHIFEPFFTTKELGRGTGLGLATVRGMVEQCGGRIEVESSAASGTAFHISLPGVAGRTPSRRPARRLPAPSGGSETILVVDDDQQLRAALGRVLRRAGYGVLEAGDGREALDVLAASAGARLVVSDVVMPRMDGGRFAAELAALHPRVKILFMSSYPPGEVLSRALREGAAAFMHKPFSPAELLGEIRAALDG